jgi:cold shock CspA family protein
MRIITTDTIVVLITGNNSFSKMASVDSSAPAAAPEASPADNVVGCVRRFNRKLGYGFISVISAGDHQGEDIFVHQSSIKLGNSNRPRMLFIGECVEFSIGPSGKPEHPTQAINVGGFNGNSLMCDNSSIIFRMPFQGAPGKGGRPQQFRGPRGPRRQQETE